MRIERELERRRCRTNLAAFCTKALVPVEQLPARHHLFLLDELTRVALGETDRLAVFMPPGSAKTTYASILFPAWMQSRHAGIDMIGASYNSEYAEDISGRVQAVVRENEDVLGYRLMNEGKKLWRTSMRGQYRAAGAGSGITGRRADLVIIDDPIKGREDADSPTIREKVWKWYRAEVITRLKPGARIVLIQTRWHEDDLAGRLLGQMADGADQWRILNLPAIAEAEDDMLGREIGEALWPEWEDVAALERKRRAIGDREWSALFQQRPAPQEGALFKIDKIGIVPTAPVAGGAVVRAWDLASTESHGNNNPDWTAGVKLSRMPNGQFIVLDVRRSRVSPHGVDEAIKNTASQDGHAIRIGLPIDPGQAGKYQAQYQVGMLAGYRVEATPESGSKVTRATPAAAQVEVGNVSLVKAPWNDAFLEELGMFPAGTHDDQVDAFSRAFGMLTGIRGPMRISDAVLHQASAPPPRAYR